MTVTGIQVKQLAPVYVNATKTFNATSDKGVVFVQSIQSNLEVGSVSAATDASLIAPQNILSAGTSAVQVQTGGDLTLLAGGGDIAASDSGGSYTPFVIQVGGTLASAGAAQALDLQQATGDLRFQRIASGDDSFVSVPGGSLIQTATGVGIAADSLTVNAQNAIGSSSQLVTILLKAPDGRIFADAGGSVWIYSASGTGNTNGDLNISHVFSSGGDVTLEADGSILNPDATGSASVHGNTIDLVTNAGSVGTPGHDLLIDSRFSGSGVLNGSVTGGDLHLIETLGDLYLGTVTVSATGGPYTAFITDPLGSILNGKASGTNLTSPEALLLAADNIGQATQAVATQVGYIESESTTGSTWMSNQGGLTVGGVTTAAESMGAGGSITVTASGPITITREALATGPIIYSAQPSTVAGAPNDDLIVAAGATVESTTSSVDLRAGRSLYIEDGALVLAATTANIYGDYGGTDPNVGTTMLVNGSISAPTIGIYGGPGDDIITVDMSGSGDTLTGTLTIWGEAGNDYITVIDGGTNITIYGNDGDDIISVSGSGVYTIYGGTGNDTIIATDGNDYIDGGTGNDTIYGGDGSDTIYAGDGNDYIYGGSGSDTIYGGAGNDTIYGGSGNNVIHGGSVDNLIYGGTGTDTIYGGGGSNEIHGSALGSVIYGGSGSNIIYGGSGGTDVIYGGTGPNRIYGGGGANWIHGGPGSDIIVGGAGNNTIIGGGGADLLEGGPGNNIIYGNTGADTATSYIYGGGATNKMYGSANDLIFGTNAVNPASERERGRPRGPNRYASPPQVRRATSTPWPSIPCPRARSIAAGGVR